MIMPRRTKAARGYCVALCTLVLLHALCAITWAHPTIEPSLLPPFHTLYQSGYPIGPGAYYEMYHLQSNDIPLQVHVVRLSSLEHTQLSLSLPFGRAQSRQTVPGQVASRVETGETVIAAINGDFFLAEPGYAGVSLGLAVQDGRIIRHPRGSAFGLLMDGQTLIGEPQWVGMVRAFDGERFLGEYPLSGINVPRHADDLILFTPDFGPSTATNLWGRELILSAPEPPAPTSGFSAPVLMDYASGDTVISPGTMVLSGHGRAAEFLALPHTPYLRLEISWSMKSPWNESLTAVGGGPVLLREGIILPDGVAGAPLPDRASPRSGIAISADGSLLLVCVDGRQPHISAGLTLHEFAHLLQSLGAVSALNLDGGGSSTMVVRNLGQTSTEVVNSPSDGRPRPVGNALIVTSTARGGGAEALFILPVLQPLLTGSTITLQAIALDGAAHAVPLPPGPGVGHSPDGLGLFSDDLVFTAQRPGTGEIKIEWGHLAGSTSVTVLSVDDIDRIDLDPVQLQVDPGDRSPLDVTLYDAWGREIYVSHPAWSWQVEGPIGEVMRDAETGREFFLASTEPGRGIIHMMVGDKQHSLPVTVGDPPPFLDVGGHWSEGDIRLASAKGWIHGYPDATFRPDQPVTRGEFVKLVASSLQPQVASSLESLPFIDTNEMDDWLIPYLLSAVESEWVTGFEDGSFRPHEPILREAATTILMRALKLAEQAVDAALLFEDSEKISPWAHGPVVNASQMQLIQGFEDNTFRPQSHMTRAETVTILCRTFLLPLTDAITIATR